MLLTNFLVQAHKNCPKWRVHVPTGDIETAEDFGRLLKKLNHLKRKYLNKLKSALNELCIF